MMSKYDLDEKRKEELIKEFVEAKITLGRLENAINHVTGVALTAELSHAFMALEETDHIFWLHDQQKKTYIAGLEEALQILSVSSSTENAENEIKEKIAQAEGNSYWTPQR